MSNFTETTARVAAVKTIGRGERLTETLVPLIVAAVPEGFDASKRGAVAAFVQTWTNGTDDASAWPKQKTGAAGEQTTTDYGRGVDTLTRAVKRALAEPTEETTEEATPAVVTAHGLKMSDRDAFLTAAAAEWDAARKA